MWHVQVGMEGRFLRCELGTNTILAAHHLSHRHREMTIAL